MDNIFPELMARFRCLSLYYQQIHWTCKGSWFYQDHLLAERLYLGVDAMLDEIAEKGIGATGSTEHVLMPPILAKVITLFNVYPVEVGSNGEYWRAALAMEKSISEWLEPVAKNHIDMGVQDLLMGYLNEGLQRVYLVRARAMGYGPEATEEDYPHDDEDDN